MMLVDGSGRGYAAKVDADNRLAVEVSGGIRGASQSGTAWSLNNNDSAQTLSVTATGGIMFYVANSIASSTAVVIEDVTVSTDTAGVVYSSGLGQGGETSDSTVASGIPLNVGSAAKPAATLEIWDEAGGTDGIGGLSGGSVTTNAILGVGTTVVDDGGALVLPPGGTFSGSLHGASECTFTVRFYEVSL